MRYLPKALDLKPSENLYPELPYFLPNLIGKKQHLTNDSHGFNFIISILRYAHDKTNVVQCKVVLKEI